MKTYHRLAIVLGLTLSLLGCDSANNTPIKASDTTAPVITITGADETVERCNTYTDKGATALDDKDGVVQVTPSSNINTDIAGDYEVTYTTKDSANPANTATKTRKVTVVDTVAPVITLQGSPSVTIAKGVIYTDAGATASDCGGINIPVTTIFKDSAGVVVTQAELNNKVGNYTVTYTALDSSGNTAQATRNVTITPQTLSITGAPHIHTNCKGTVDKSGLDTNDNNVLEDSEVTSLTNAVYKEGTPVTRKELDTMISQNKDITGVNTCEIESMNALFRDKTTFNQDISGWNVGSVTNMNNMFRRATTFNQDISAWNVSNVTSMNSMFSGAAAFNQDISAWNVSKVTNMNSMFYDATAFNQDISAWNVSKVTNMNRMFYNAKEFVNHNLSTWDVAKVTAHLNFLTGAGSGNTEPNWP
ncbi:MAG: BspA family leucine-rich repeat surface protein [Cocleimonas sp.]|nr:BspA family leucine-rich repeat surface protein [Cocleimonas sp.]